MAFATSTAFSFILFLIKRKTEVKSGVHVDFSVSPKSVVFIISVMLICGICAGLNNSINLYLSGVVDSVVFFLIVNGVPLMASLITSFLIFKEKLSVKQIIGLICGIIAIVFFFI